MSKISDRTTTIQLMLGNRSDLADRIPRWTANAYIELGSNIPFPDLEEGPDDITTAAGADSYAYPTNALGITSCTMTFQGAKRAIRKKNIEYIDLYPTSNPGPPVVWAPFKNEQVFRPVPDRDYLITRRFWKKPMVDQTTINTINNTTLLLPDNWLEVLDYAAALRGFVELEENSKAGELRMLLYGDPKHPADNPGLIKQRLTRIQTENMNSDYGMRMRIRNYTSL